MTFHQRAALLKSLATYLREHREELYEPSLRTGATPADARFDVDGGIGVLFSYASRGRRELPDDTVLTEGPAEPLGKGGHFAAQHVMTPMRGVAVQINAFNFPVWGPLEKLAPALLAGMPSLIKPAAPSAYVTVRLVELIAGSGLLPDGAVQLFCGDARGLLDHLTEQDLVAFTGSAATARALRAHPVVAARAARFTAEADSLNCSILGPDAGPGGAEFGLFVDQLVTEMTVKAGQKCTAIRRALVPAPLLGAVAEAVAGRLAAVTVGHPAHPDTRMGPLVSLAQRDEVRRALKELTAAGTVVYGDPDRVEVAGADPGTGAFLSPVLLRAADPGRPEPQVAGAPRATGGPHPFRKHLEDLRPGDTVVAGQRRVTLEDIERFAALTGDTFYAHMDEEAARANPFFDGRVAHGYLVVSLAAGLFVDPEPGPVLANYGLENLRFRTPVHPGDELTVTLTAKHVDPRAGAPYGEVRWDAEVTNQHGAVVAAYDVLTMVARRPGVAPEGGAGETG